MSGMGGWSAGNQSAGPKPSRICARVNSKLLPARRFGLVSGAACAPRPPAPAGAAGAPGCGKPYAQAGGPSAAKETLTANADASVIIRIPDELFIWCPTFYTTHFTALQTTSAKRRTLQSWLSAWARAHESVDFDCAAL